MLGIFGRRNKPPIVPVQQRMGPQPEDVANGSAPVPAQGTRGMFGRAFDRIRQPDADGIGFRDRLAISAAMMNGEHLAAMSMRKSLAEQAAARRKAEQDAAWEGRLGAARAGALFPSRGSMAGFDDGASDPRRNQTEPPAPTFRPPPVDPNDPNDPTSTVVVMGERLRQPPPPRPATVSIEDDLDMQLRLARDWANETGDWSRFNAIAGQVGEARKTAAEAQRTGQAGIAAQLLQIPPGNDRTAAARRYLEMNGIDPADSDFDDHLDDATLRSRMAMGAPEQAAKEGIRVRGTFDEFRRPETLDLGGRRVVVGMSGDDAGEEIASFGVTADPNAVLSAETTRRGQNMTAATARRGQDVQMRIANLRAQAEAIEARARLAQGAEKLDLERQALGLRQQELDLTRNWMQPGGSLSGASVQELVAAANGGQR